MAKSVFHYLIVICNIRLFLGAIREAGGAFAAKEKAQEDQYFRKLQAQQLADMHKHHEDEIQNHEKEIQRHQEAIQRHKDKLEQLKKHWKQNKGKETWAFFVVRKRKQPYGPKL